MDSKESSKASKMDGKESSKMDTKDEITKFPCHKCVLTFNFECFKTKFLSSMKQSSSITTSDHKFNTPIISESEDLDLQVDRFSDDLKQDTQTMNCFINIMYKGNDCNGDEISKEFNDLSSSQKCQLIQTADKFLCDRVLIWIYSQLSNTIYDHNINILDLLSVCNKLGNVRVKQKLYNLIVHYNFTYPNMIVREICTCNSS